MDRYLGKIDNEDFYVDSTNVTWYRNPRDFSYTPCFEDKTGRYIAIPLNKNGSLNNFTDNNSSMSRSLSEGEYTELKSKFPDIKDNVESSIDARKKSGYVNNNFDYTFLQEGYTYTTVDPKYGKIRRFTDTNTTEIQNSKVKGNTYGKNINGGGPISRDFNYSNLRCSFFDLLGLSRANDPSGAGFFVPIVLKPDSPFVMQDEYNELDGMVIELPMEGGISITDNVSVRFDRRLDSNFPWSNLIGAGAANAGGNIGAGSDLQQSLANFAMFSYDTRSLRKTLSLSFIIPVTMATKQVRIEDIRGYLSNLQGMVFPTTLSKIMYPPLMSLTIGGMYQRFFGFITEVSIEWGSQGEFIHLNNSSGNFNPVLPGEDSVFPQVIKGQLKFENLFTYDWGSSMSEFSGDVTKYFTLKKDRLEGTLFGVGDNGAVSGVFDGIDYSQLAANLQKIDSSVTSTSSFDRIWNKYINEYGWNDYFFEPFTIENIGGIE